MQNRFHTVLISDTYDKLQASLVFDLNYQLLSPSGKLLDTCKNLAVHGNDWDSGILNGLPEDLQTYIKNWYATPLDALDVNMKTSSEVSSKEDFFHELGHLLDSYNMTLGVNIEGDTHCVSSSFEIIDNDNNKSIFNIGQDYISGSQDLAIDNTNENLMHRDSVGELKITNNEFVHTHMTYPEYKMYAQEKSSENNFASIELLRWQQRQLMENR